jgi:hypothetical protein
MIPPLSTRLAARWAQDDVLMTASFTPGRFPVRLARILVVCAPLGAWGACEPMGSSGTFRSERPELATFAQTPRSRTASLAGDPMHTNPALADPRNDPVTLAWAILQLEPGRWRTGYAKLVEAAARAPRIAWQGGGRPRAGDRAADEGVLGSEREEGVEALVADLLGATLVDAQDELWTAWRALERAGYPEPARKLLTEPPPWPPASVEKYLRREGESSMSLVETLAAELAPTPSVRGWLVRSWLSPPRMVDESLLTELAQAADGRLRAEPRLRAWLRAEWTASARQRYRRVTRLVALSQPNSLAAERSRLKP